jgi:hypothetical protein
VIVWIARKTYPLRIECRICLASQGGLLRSNCTDRHLQASADPRVWKYQANIVLSGYPRWPIPATKDGNPDFVVSFVCLPCIYDERST